MHIYTYLKKEKGFFEERKGGFRERLQNTISMDNICQKWGEFWEIENLILNPEFQFIQKLNFFSIWSILSLVEMMNMTKFLCPKLPLGNTKKFENKIYNIYFLPQYFSWKSLLNSLRERVP